MGLTRYMCALIVRGPALIVCLTFVVVSACVTQSQRSFETLRWTPPTQLDLDAFLSDLITEGTAWIRSERQRLRPTARAIESSDRERFATYFRADTLDSVRYQVVERIQNPGFYAGLAERGIDVPLDFSLMDGIAFIDTVAVSKRNLDNLDLTRLLFHETVHVAQYRHLGPDEFVSRYVAGWADNGFDYFSIPLEVQAYELERRFASGEIFSVEEAIAEQE